MARVTDQQILDFIDLYHEKHGYAPSMRDVMVGVGLVSVGAIRYRMGILKEKGLVSFEPGQARTLKVVH